MKWFRSKAITSGLVGALSAMLALTGCGPEARAKQDPAAQDPGRAEEGRPEEIQVSAGPPSTYAWQVLEPDTIYEPNRATSRIVTDSSGNVLTLASFWRNGSERTLELLKLDPQGQPLWRKVFSWNVQLYSSDIFPDLAVDAQDNILLAGQSAPSTDLGQGPLGKRSFVAKFSPDGTLLWDTPLCDELGILAVAVDSQGAVWLGGQVGLDCNVGGGVRWWWDSPGWQGYLAKFDANGEYVFDRVIGGRGDQVLVKDLATASDDGVVVVGERRPNFTSTRTGFVSKFASNGPHRWLREYPQASGDFSAVARLGDDLVATGSFSGTMRFNGQDYPSGAHGYGRIAVYSLTGEERWLGHLGAWVKSVSTGPLGIMALTVCESSSPCPTPDVQFGGTGAMLGLFSPTGTRLWTAGFGPFHASVWQVAYHPTGEVSLTGDVDWLMTYPRQGKRLIQHLRPQ